MFPIKTFFDLIKTTAVITTTAIATGTAIVAAAKGIVYVSDKIAAKIEDNEIISKAA